MPLERIIFENLQLVRITNKVDLHSSIGDAFREDDDLVHQYHVVAGTGLINCVKDTFEKIVEAEELLNLNHYRIMSEGVNVGYVCVAFDFGGMNLLYSFGLGKKHRKDYSGKFFSAIKVLMNGSFICGLWAKNTRAIKFLERNGMRVLDRTIINNTEIVMLCL